MELKDIFCIKGNFGSAGSDKGNAKGNSNPRVFSIFFFFHFSYLVVCVLVK